MRLGHGLLLVGLLVIAGCSKGPSGAQSYKYVRVKEQIPPGRTNLAPDEESVEHLLQQAVKIPVTFEYFGKVLHSAVIVVRDMNDLTFTVRLDGDKGTISR